MYGVVSKCNTTSKVLNRIQHFEYLRINVIFSNIHTQTFCTLKLKDKFILTF